MLEWGSLRTLIAYRLRLESLLKGEAFPAALPKTGLSMRARHAPLCMSGQSMRVEAPCRERMRHSKMEMQESRSFLRVYAFILVSLGCKLLAKEIPRSCTLGMGMGPSPEL